MPRKRRSYPAELKAKPIPILGGARLSGKVSNSVTVGVLNMQTRVDGADSRQQLHSGPRAAGPGQSVEHRWVVCQSASNRQPRRDWCWAYFSQPILEGDRSLFSPAPSPLVPRQWAQSANSLGKWRARQDSNLRPSAWYCQVEATSDRVGR